MNTPEQVETLRQARVIAANEALIEAGLWHQPPRRPYVHAPFCPEGERCCCSGRWIRIREV